MIEWCSYLIEVIYFSFFKEVLLNWSQTYISGWSLGIRYFLARVVCLLSQLRILSELRHTRPSTDFHIQTKQVPYIVNNILLLQYIVIVQYILQKVLQYILHLPPHIAITIGETSEKEVSKIVWKIS